LLYYNLKQFNDKIPNQGRILALDVGTKNIGTAICDELRFLSSPKSIIQRKNFNYDTDQIKKIASDNQICAILIGLPLNMDSTNSKISDYVTNFAQNLSDNIDLEICMVDERLTSFEAKDIAIKKGSYRKTKQVDNIAAAFILEYYLNQIQIL